MADFNRVILVGNLTRDPDYRQLASGQAVCRLGLATNRQFKNRQTGTLIQEVCYINIDVWGAQAESCNQYLQKGRSVLVEGRLKFDTWEDPNGQTRNKHSVVADRVVFLSSNAGPETMTAATVTQENTANTANIANTANTMQQNTQQADSDGVKLDPNNSVEKELLDQLEKVQNKVKAAKSVKPKKQTNPVEQDTVTSTGEIDFKDEPPFEDNLPF